MEWDSYDDPREIAPPAGEMTLCPGEDQRECSPPAGETAEAHAYLCRLLVHHAPNCEPLPDLLGICSQIDNLLMRAPAGETHRCSGCGHRWPGGPALPGEWTGAELCGDCWRKAQPVLQAPAGETAQERIITEMNAISVLNNIRGQVAEAVRDVVQDDRWARLTRSQQEASIRVAVYGLIDDHLSALRSEREGRMKNKFDLYPPVELPQFPPSWEDVERLARHYPAVYHAVVMVERGDWTREQALIMAVFALAQAFQKLFSAEVERRMNEPSKPLRRDA